MLEFIAEYFLPAVVTVFVGFFAYESAIMVDEKKRADREAHKGDK